MNTKEIIECINPVICDMAESITMMEVATTNLYVSIFNPDKSIKEKYKPIYNKHYKMIYDNIEKLLNAKKLNQAEVSNSVCGKCGNSNVLVVRCNGCFEELLNEID